MLSGSLVVCSTKHTKVVWGMGSTDFEALYLTENKRRREVYDAVKRECTPSINRKYEARKYRYTFVNKTSRPIPQNPPSVSQHFFQKKFSPKMRLSDSIRNQRVFSRKARHNTSSITSYSKAERKEQNSTQTMTPYGATSPTAPSRLPQSAPTRGEPCQVFCA